MTPILMAVACLFATMFFSAAEMAFIAANRLKLKHLAEEGHAGARRYLDSFHQPERFLSTAMMGVTLAHIIAASVTTSTVLPVLGPTAPLVVTLVLTPVMLVAGEVIPKAVAVFQERGFSRLPIYRQRVTNLIGVVTVMDLFHRGSSARTVEELMRQPYYVPETKRIDDLLREMQRARVHLVIVVDEYGGSTGVVTLEDIVEQIVGEIRDEHDRTPAAVERLPDGSYRVLARTEVDEINEALDWDLPKNDYETIAGLVLASLHRIPRTGEEFQLRGYTITVLEADARRVRVVKIARSAKPEGG